MARHWGCGGGRPDGPQAPPLPRSSPPRPPLPPSRPQTQPPEWGMAVQWTAHGSAAGGGKGRGQEQTRGANTANTGAAGGGPMSSAAMCIGAVTVRRSGRF